MAMESLRALFVKELKDAYDFEQQLVEALPEMARAATTPDLQDAFEEHLEQTKGHVNRLEQVFSSIGAEPERETCKGMKGLVAEGEEILSEEFRSDDPAQSNATKDAAIIAAAQRVEHYEIAAYGTLRTYADTLGEEKAAELLDEILDEESEADEKLTDLAVKLINPTAAEKH